MNGAVGVLVEWGALVGDRVTAGEVIGTINITAFGLLPP